MRTPAWNITIWAKLPGENDFQQVYLVLKRQNRSEAPAQCFFSSWTRTAVQMRLLVAPLPAAASHSLNILLQPLSKGLKHNFKTFNVVILKVLRGLKLKFMSALDSKLPPARNFCVVAGKADGVQIDYRIFRDVV